MRKNSQLCRYFALSVVLLGLAFLASQVNAQRPPEVTQAQAQEPQAGQQPAQQPEQYPTQQPNQQQPAQPPQYTPQPQQQAPGAQAGQMQGVQTFTGTIVKSGDKYVLQDSSTGKTYDIDHQNLVGQHVGRKVRVNGTLDRDGKTIHLQPSQR